MENLESFEDAAERINSVKNIMDAARQISVGFGDMKENCGGNFGRESKTVIIVSRRVQELSLLQQPK